jgi:pyridoxamine 5'-phosphate oxidase
MNARIEGLQTLRASCWQQLQHAATDARHGWHHMVLSTQDSEGVDARTVVLRDVEAPLARLAFYSDSRSAKVAQLRAQPRATLVTWSGVLSWQLRLRANFEVADSGLDVSSRWARMKLSPAAQDYLSPLPPGTQIERYQLERGTREHFCVLWAQVLSMDWVELHPDGHRRARFDDEGARWLVP